MPLHPPACNTCSVSLSLGVQTAFDILIATRYLHSVSPVDISISILIRRYLSLAVFPFIDSLPLVQQSPAGGGLKSDDI